MAEVRSSNWVRLIAVFLAVLAAVALPAAAAGPTGAAVLETGSFWRCHFTWKSVQLRRASGELEFVSVDWPSRGKAKVAPLSEPVRTPVPPAGWREVEFDDADWARARGPLFTRGTRRIALLCARGKFRVADPAGTGGLSLALAYRGGAVVYVNGTEIARGHLPKGGLDAETPAEDYDEKAYLAGDGFLLRAAFGEPKKYPDRFALRKRSLTVEVPVARLRKGVNVLAVELHRAPVAEVFYVGKYRESRSYFLWDMVGLEEVSLTARRGGGIVGGVDRPAGVQVWNQPVWVSVHNTDFGEATEALRPIEIVGARNGAFSGQVVVSSPSAIRGASAAMSDLKAPGGAAIPAAACQVRYGLPGDHAVSHNEHHRARAPIPDERIRRRFDGLVEAPPAEVAVDPKARSAVLPVWVTVRVPRGAAPGDYAGRLTVRAEGLEPVAIPVTCHVADWTLPETKAFRSHMGLIQSPESLAVQYGKAMWSDDHWRLIDRSFELLAQVGTKVVYIPLLAKTYFGNEHAMVRWIERPGGTYGHDFSIVERYLDTAVRHLGKVPVVCLYCWDVNTGSKYFGTRKFAQNAGLPFTVLDPSTGMLKAATGPKWGQPEVRAFWKPVMAGLRKVLARRGLGESMLVGVAGDRRPNRDAVEDLKAVAPDAPWVCSSHSGPADLFGQPVGYRSDVWGLSPAPDPAEKRYYGWRNPFRLVAFPRAGSSVVGVGLRHRSALGAYRIAMESALTARGKGAGLRGIGRCGADFWDVLPGPRRKRPVLGRYPETSHWHGGWLRNSTPFVLAPGATGPVATVRFEMLREGIQEAEARIFLEDALTTPARRKRLGEPLAKRCQDLLDERVRAHRRAIEGGGRYLTWASLASSGMGDRARRLYAAAGQVRAALH